ncbi:NFACT family protein [Nanoarchaeota archaeon]
MKTEISSLELHYLLKELQQLISAKVEQVYQIAREELIIQFHIPNQGKRFLRIILGRLLYLASHKGEIPERPHGFCLFLRRRLKNARVRAISQPNFERVIEFAMETKDERYKLAVELFSKGNILLANADSDKIITVLEKREWKDRSIKPGAELKYPEKEFNFLEIERPDLDTFLNKSDKESLVKTLALELGIGGAYAEELCIMAKVDKTLKPNQLSDKEKDALHEAIKTLKEKDISPRIIYKDEAKKEVKDIIPFELDFYNNLYSTEEPDFNAALDKILTQKVEEKAIEATEKTAKTKIDKVNEMLKQQIQRIEGLEKSEKENQRKGEIIYENYPLIEQAIKEILELRKDHSWKEIKERFKGHKLLKDVNEKTGEITLEI